VQRSEKKWEYFATNRLLSTDIHGWSASRSITAELLQLHKKYNSTYIITKTKGRVKSEYLHAKNQWKEVIIYDANLTHKNNSLFLRFFYL